MQALGQTWAFGEHASRNGSASGIQFSTSVLYAA